MKTTRTVYGNIRKYKLWLDTTHWTVQCVDVWQSSLVSKKLHTTHRGHPSTLRNVQMSSLSRLATTTKRLQ